LWHEWLKSHSESRRRTTQALIQRNEGVRNMAAKKKAKKKTAKKKKK
jgi:hypothetical protein